MIATYANPTGLRICVPANIISSILVPRSCLALCSPRTHLTASATLLLPLPLGPTIPVIPLLNSKTILLAKDLKPCTSILFKYILPPMSIFSVLIWHHRLPAVRQLSYYDRFHVRGLWNRRAPLPRMSYCAQDLPRL